MEYSVSLFGTNYTLPNYTVKIAAEIEATEQKKFNAKTNRDGFKLMYDFCANMIGKEQMIEAVGKFDAADPNRINIAYLSIIDAFNEPYKEYMQDKQATAIPDDFKELLKGISDLSASLKDLKKKK